jgi:hypothetical protein
LKVHRTLAGRLLSALRVDDPLVAASRLPRSEGLRMFLQAARPLAGRETVALAEKALCEFEDLVHGELGGWDGFEAALSEWLPDARIKLELASKQLAFRGMCNIIGARADVQLITSIYHPGADGRTCDIAAIDGSVGLRRLRPGARIPLATVGVNPSEPAPLGSVVAALNQDGSDDQYPVLREFCTQPAPRFTAERSGDITHYLLAGDAIGTRSGVDVFTAGVVRGLRPLRQDAAQPRRRVSNSAGLNVPTAVLVMHVLLHDDVWPNCPPELVIYDTHLHGPASPNDRTRDISRLDLLESIQDLGRGSARFRCAEVGQHVEMVRSVCAELGWDAEKLRAYRLRVRYPLYNAQYCMVFDPPVAD